MEKIKLEHKLPEGEKIVRDGMAKSYLWLDFRQMEGPLSEQTVNIKRASAIEVRSVSGSGITEIRLTGEETRTEKFFNEEPETITTECLPRIYKVRKTGEVIWSDIGEYEHPNPQDPVRDTAEWYSFICQQISPLTVLPEWEVGVGDTWTMETYLTGPDGGQLKMTTRSRLFALGEVGEFDCAWIQSEIELPIRIEFNGNFDGYSTIAMEGAVNTRELSYFGYKEGVTIKDKSSINVEVILDVDGLKAPIIEHLDDTLEIHQNF